MVMDGTSDTANKTHRTIFAELLESNLPESAKSIEKMTGEAQVVLGAGSVTTAHTLATMTYHMLANPDILARARKEIANVMPQSSHQPPDLHKLEELPYFVGPLTLPLNFQSYMTTQDRLYTRKPALFPRRGRPHHTHFARTDEIPRLGHPRRRPDQHVHPHDAPRRKRFPRPHEIQTGSMASEGRSRATRSIFFQLRQGASLLYRHVVSFPSLPFLELSNI